MASVLDRVLGFINAPKQEDKQSTRRLPTGIQAGFDTVRPLGSAKPPEPPKVSSLNLGGVRDAAMLLPTLYDTRQREQRYGEARRNLLDLLLNQQNQPSPTPTLTPAPTPTAMPTPQMVYPQIDNPWTQANRERLALPFKEQRYGSPAPIPPELLGAVQQASRIVGIPEEILFSLAYNESGFQNIPERSGGGGRGYFQFDLTQRPDITPEMALDPLWAAQRTAEELRNRMESVNPYTGQPFTLWEAVAAHNVGPSGVYSDVISPYYGIPLRDRAKEYADNIFNYASDRDWY